MVYESDIAYDVVVDYEELRKNGLTREEAIERIRKDYFIELQDFDDRIDVLIGIAIALSKKKELFASAADEIRKEIKSYGDIGDEKTVFASVEKLLDEDSLYGPEKVWKTKKKYVPEWKAGDVFLREMTCETSRDIGLFGWYILIYKVDEYIDYQGYTGQLVLVSLCPHDKLPQNAEELKELGFVRMMRQRDGYEYTAQMKIKSKKSETGYGFTKLANFGAMELPQDNVEVPPCVATPLFGLLRKTDELPAYEKTICLYYSWNGIGK